jgi:hypothetical protein
MHVTLLHSLCLEALSPNPYHWLVTQEDACQACLEGIPHFVWSFLTQKCPTCLSAPMSSLWLWPVCCTEDPPTRSVRPLVGLELFLMLCYYELCLMRMALCN